MKPVRKNVLEKADHEKQKQKKNIFIPIAHFMFNGYITGIFY